MDFPLCGDIGPLGVCKYDDNSRSLPVKEWDLYCYICESRLGPGSYCDAVYGSYEKFKEYLGRDPED